MRKSRKNHGFSLTEVLLSVGVLSVGMIFIAGVFPVGIHFATIATEQTIAVVVADEAFAKIKIYAMGDLSDPSDDIRLGLLKNDGFTDFYDITVFPAMGEMDPNLNEFAYPSADTGSQKQYCWSALCRRVGADPNRLVQLTVFVSRKVSPNLKYYHPAPGGNGEVGWPPHVTGWPVPVKVEVDKVIGEENELKIDKTEEKTFINDGYTIVDNETGDIYRVLERYRDEPKTILLDREWEGLNKVWVVPPPLNGGRYPCIAIYQKVIGF